MAVSQQRPAPLPPAEVGVVEAEDVVLGQRRQPGTWPLRVLTEHPVLFDHPLDHVPGMLVLEGMRQASRAVLGRPHAQPTACDITFSRFIEAENPSLVKAEVQQRSGVTATMVVTLVQTEHTAVQGMMTMTNIADEDMSRSRVTKRVGSG